uniref:Inositol-1-monophosphatase n=1 Tax=uncultured Chloroflexota bacterium TaxID=166587 RepID=H5SID0_9CHLR|nr:myo-inositol-1(or 4)-monophosphatase [uncultured Chloroflexota bacterium]BAL55916.1 myo-inositol-1(or 4)-monophosphatase [uncultured Chloroflexota bacterium]
MAEEIEIMVRAAQRAGRLIRRHFGRHHQAMSKQQSINLVTEVDRHAQKVILETLQNAFPEYEHLVEEEARPPSRNRPYWVIDPLDGTTNFIHGYPMLAISIALVKNERIEAGVVYQPLSRELFMAKRGGGAMLNNRPIRVSSTSRLSESLLASGFPYDAWENPENNTYQWAEMLRKVVSLRSDGSAALDLCFVACGRLDGYWELDLDPWDTAAGSLIVAEAGGMVTDLEGNPFHLSKRSIVAANPAIHGAMLKVLTRKK